MEHTNSNNNEHKTTQIYMVTDYAYTEKYIGSTTDALSSRMAQHRKNTKDLRMESTTLYQCTTYLINTMLRIVNLS